MINTWILGALIGLALMIGTFAGWMLCALMTMSVDRDLRTWISRLASVVRGFLDATEQYHDDQQLANLRRFAQDLLDMQD